MTRRFRRRVSAVVAVLAAIVPSLVAAAPASQADVAASARLAIATWAAPIGGSSDCVNVGSVAVRCTHDYDSFDRASRVETCSELGTHAVGVTTCHASLSGNTSGPGRVVGQVATVCSTTGVRTLTFQFGGLSGAYPAFAVSAAVEDGDGTFSGTSDPVLLPGIGLIVQSASGKFTFGCGPREPELGSFAGSWTLTTV